jgi:pyruvate,orthophosphate dikinase
VIEEEIVTAPTTDAVIRTLFIKGFGTVPLLAPALLTTEDQLPPVLTAVQAEGLIEPKGVMYRLTDAGKSHGEALLAADRTTWGAAAATAALDGFLALDHRMKEVVTSWQMRIVADAQVINDHTDTAYDAGVLAAFAALHTDAAAWLAPCVIGLPRLGDYAARLEIAAGKVAGGDHTFIASPRVDSYHSIWFELHEDLIRLAGRTREDEVAAGRA